jgi:hypothetical protein
MAKAGRVQKSSFRTDRSDASGGRLLGPFGFNFAIDRPRGLAGNAKRGRRNSSVLSVTGLPGPQVFWKSPFAASSVPRALSA